MGDYALMPLDELDVYVRKGKHLPNVTSAAEVKEKGVDLTKLPQVLLEKVEELTLHLLSVHNEQKRHKQQIAEKDAEIAQLKTEMSNMRSRMERLEAFITSRETL